MNIVSTPKHLFLNLQFSVCFCTHLCDYSYNILTISEKLLNLHEILSYKIVDSSVLVTQCFSIHSFTSIYFLSLY